MSKEWYILLMFISDPEYVAGQLLSFMVVHFGVRPQGAVLLADLSVLAQHMLNVQVEDVVSGVGFAADQGWVVNQSNGLIRITDVGYVNALSQ